MAHIITNFLVASPPGEFDACYADIQGLLGPSAGQVFPQEALEDAQRRYDQDQMIGVTNGDHSVLLSTYNNVGGNSYVDSKGKQTIIYNHVSKAVESSSPCDVDFDVEPWRSALETEAGKYASGYFLNASSGVYAQPREGGAFVVRICVSAAIFKGHAFYTGRWRSDYSVVFTPGKTGDIVGVVKTNVHFFEGGNVQLNASVNKSKRGVPCLNPAEFATNVVQSINAMETDYQVQFEAVYDNLDQTSFKALRRALPMKRELLRWPQIMTYKLGDDLIGGKK